MAELFPEDVARRVLDLFEDNFQAALTTVSGSRDSTETVTLTDFATRRFTADNPTILRDRWQYPALIIAVGDLNDLGPQGDTRFQASRHNLYSLAVAAVMYLKDADSHLLAVKTMRYTEAAMRMLSDHPGLDYAGDGLALVQPGTVTFAPSGVSAQENTMVKGVMLSFDFRFPSYGF